MLSSTLLLLFRRAAPAIATHKVDLFLPNWRIEERAINGRFATAAAAATAATAAATRLLPAHPPSSPGACQVITPWDVTGGADGKIDYNKLVAQVWLPPSVAAYPAGSSRRHRSSRNAQPCAGG